MVGINVSGAKTNTQLNKLNLLNTIKSAIETEMAAVCDGLLNEWYGVFPALNLWLVPNSTSDHVRFCMEKRPTKCS